MAAARDARKACASNTQDCKVDMISDDAPLLQVAVKQHDVDMFTPPQDLMGDCGGELVLTTPCMTGDMYDEVVNAVGGILFDELDQACSPDHCQVADWAGCVLRMCGHDFMDFHDGKGGADGCTDMNEPDNAGLEACLASGEFDHSLKDVYGAFCARMSLADFEVIAAQAVMSLLATEGAPRETLSAGLKNNFLYGRTTATGDACWDATHRHGQLILPNPAEGCADVKRVFVDGMNLDWEEATALMGVHSLGRAKTTNSGYDGYWMKHTDALKFNNEYYTALIAVSWCPEFNVGNNPAKHQWKRCDNGSQHFEWKEMMLNTDMCLAYADKSGNPLIAAPGNDDSNCCAWVHSYVEDYNMTDVIANNRGEFCNRKCEDYPGGKCGVFSRQLRSSETNQCCFLEPKPRKDCQTPGLGAASKWIPKARKNAPAAEYVRKFAASRLAWINVFLVAWKKSTENGFAGKLSPLADTCEVPNAAGWYASGEVTGCDAACGAKGLVCTENGLFNHNSDVDTTEKVLTLINQLGESTGDTDCSDEWGDNPDVPQWRPTHCNRATVNRALDTFDCTAAPKADPGRQRLCYCHEA